MSRLGWAPFVLLLALSAGCASGDATRDAARRRGLEFVEAEGRRLDKEHADRYVVVQEGRLAASASAPDDALRAAERTETTPLHRFVFRPADRGDRVYRMAYMPTGGVVVGRRFFDALRARATWTAGRPLVIEHLGVRREVDLERTPRLEIEVTTLDQEHRRTLSAVVDLAFDGALLVPEELAVQLEAHLFEVPGRTEVQVALGRPFAARRALVFARVPRLGLGADVEIVFETRPPTAGAKP